MKKSIKTKICALLFLGSILCSLYVLVVADDSVSVSVYVFNPITDSYIYPHTVISDSLLSDTIEVRSSPGEYIAATFVINADRVLSSLNISVDDLVGDSGTITSDNIDINIVKNWYQKGNIISYLVGYNTRLYVSELLLKNSSLVNVQYISDTEGWNQLYTQEYGYIEINNLTDPAYIYATVEDSEYLQPVVLQPNTNIQYWLTIYIPSDTISDTYIGNINILNDGVTIDNIILFVDVLPFTLPSSPIDISLYYGSRLMESNNGSLGSAAFLGGRSTTQIQKEMELIKKQGLNNPVIYQSKATNITRFNTYNVLRNDTGFDFEDIYYLGYSFSSGSSEESLKSIVSDIVDYFSSNYSSTNIYIYAADEGNMSLVREQINWTRAEGGLTWNAQSWIPGRSNYAGSNLEYEPALLDLTIIGGYPVASLINSHHNKNVSVGSYDNPMGGEERPLTNRRNLGLLLWQYDIDVSCTFAFQWGINNLWNDWGWHDGDWVESGYKQHMFAYPTSNGVVNTVQFEGFREGVNDIRYVHNLELLIDEAEQRGRIDSATLSGIKDYVTSLKNMDLSSADMDSVRDEVIDYSLFLYDLLEDDVWTTSTLFGGQIYVYQNYTSTALFGGRIFVQPIYPPTNATATYTSGTNTLTVTWDDGNNSDSTVVVRNNNSIPASAGDGTILYNGSAETYDVVVAAGDSFYLSLFGYNDTANQFSTGVYVPWGAVGITAYDVNTGVDLSGYSVFVSNQAGSETYAASGVDNPYSIGFEDIPTGVKCIVRVSASGYHAHTQYHDLYTDSFYNLSFYLPPESPGGPGGPGDCSLITFHDTMSVVNPAVDCTVTLTHPMISLISVELYNTSLFGASGGGWITVAGDKYSYNSTHVVVDNSILDSNSSMVRVNYYYEYCVGDVESLLYVINVVEIIEDEYYSSEKPVANAYVEIRQYLSFVGGYVTISSLYTDGSGTVDVYLSPGVTYKLFVSKDGYDESISDWTTTVEVRTKKIVLTRTYTPPVPPVYDYFWNDIVFTGVLNNNTLSLSFTDSSARIINTTVRVYEWYNNTETYQGIYNSSSSSYSTDIIVSNGSRDHILRLWFTSSANYSTSSPVTLVVYADTEFWTPPGFVRFDIDARFGAVFGDFPLGYANTIAVLLALIALVIFGPFHAGLGVIACGMIMGLTQLLYTVFTVNANVGISGIAVFIVVIGIMYSFTIKAEEKT